MNYIYIIYIECNRIRGVEYLINNNILFEYKMSSIISNKGLLYNTFYFTYLALIGSTFITILTAISPVYARTSQNKRLIDIIIIENTVNFIAGYVYNGFLNDIKSGNVNLDELTTFRYLDWFMTTPLLLLSTTIYFDYENRKYDPDTPQLSYIPLIWIIVLDIVMLVFGYLGETKKIPRLTGLILGSIPLLIMFLIFWKYYVKSPNSKIFFWIFVVIWSSYGIAYLLNSYWKNIIYNILDFFAKVAFGLYAAFLLLLEK